MVVTLVRSGASLLGWSGGKQLFFRLFLSLWFLGIFVGLSYAGEKMPWLLVHISLPGVLLAGAMVGAHRRSWRSTPGQRNVAEDGERVELAWAHRCAIGACRRRWC